MRHLTTRDIAHDIKINKSDIASDIHIPPIGGMSMSSPSNMTAQQTQFLTYIRTKQVFELRFKGDDAGIKPVHVKSSEIEERFFPINRQATLKALVDASELQITKKLLPNGHEMHYYSVTQAGAIDFSLLPKREMQHTATTRKMVEHLKNVSLPEGALRSDYFDVFLKYKNRRIDLFFTVDSFCGRVHTPVTSLHREYRPYLHLYGKPTASIDVNTSQPLILGKILSKAIGANEFSNWIDKGEDVYIKLQELGSLSNRDTAKKMFLKMLFSPDLSLIEKTFGASSWGNWITEFKTQPYEGNKYPKRLKNGRISHHNNLAQLLQSIEVQVMLKVWKALISAGIPFLSVHDEIIVQSARLHEAERIFSTVMASQFKYFKISTKGCDLSNDSTEVEQNTMNGIKSLKSLLEELKPQVPINTAFCINGNESPCFKEYINTTLKELDITPISVDAQHKAHVIYKVLDMAGIKGFANKYSENIKHLQKI